MTDDLRAQIRHHYEAQVDEDARLRSGAGRLELARVQEVVRRHLPEGVAVVADVGGATGVHAEWLLGDGHHVHLVDLLEHHVDRAAARLGGDPRFSAAAGDARSLPLPDASVDAVLLLGPLYHLVERADRVRAWQEAHRVVRRGGVVVGMGISRFAALFDGLANGYLHDPAFRAIAERDLVTGRHLNADDDPRWFTTAYFHRPEDLGPEAVEAGLELVEVVGLEGLAGWLDGLDEQWVDPEKREVLLAATRLVEHEQSILGVSAHLLAVARRPLA